MLSKWFKAFGDWKKMAVQYHGLQLPHFLHMKPLSNLKSVSYPELEFYQIIHYFPHCFMLPCLCLCCSVNQKRYFLFIHLLKNSYIIDIAIIRQVCVCWECTDGQNPYCPWHVIFKAIGGHWIILKRALDMIRWKYHSGFRIENTLERAGMNVGISALDNNGETDTMLALCHK